jgi:hypothetical protein
LAISRPCSHDARRTRQGLPKGQLGPESRSAIDAWKAGSYNSYKIRKFCAIVIAPAEVGAEHRHGEVVTRPAGAIEGAAIGHLPAAEFQMLEPVGALIRYCLVPE